MVKKEIDYRDGQKVLGTLVLEDKGQDFTELDVLENGVILGNSIMFSNGRISLIGIGALDGITYYVLEEVIKKILKLKFKGLYVYIKDTGEKTPLPWNAKTLNYKVVGVKKPVKPNRFIKK